MIPCPQSGAPHRGWHVYVSVGHDSEFAFIRVHWRLLNLLSAQQLGAPELHFCLQHHHRVVA